MKLVDTFKKIFFPIEEPKHDFSLSAENAEMPNANDDTFDVKNIFPSIDVNMEYIKVKYNLLINSDIILREFCLLQGTNNTELFFFLLMA